MNMPSNLNIDLSQASLKQLAFFKSEARFTAYGGARGGGKSWAVRHKSVLLALNYSGIMILLLRRTYPDLYQNHIRELSKMLAGTARYVDKTKEFQFSNGSIIKLGYCQSESDVLQYQGQEYDIIFLDEATQFTEYQFETLTACLRGANDFPKRMYLTCNPGGIGHEWVKRLFVSKRYRQNEKPEDYLFIPATVFDNKALMEKDPGYINMLNNLSDGLRQAWRDGNWDMLAGQYFSEFDRNVHVVEPFPLPEHWKRFRAIDYGLDCLACVWVAIDEHGTYFVYREYAKPDKIISEGASDILSLSEGERIDYTAAPPDLWARSQESLKGKSDLFSENGLPLVKASADREAGWLALKDLLKVTEREDGKTSRLKIFSCCEQLIECLPALQRDLKKSTDCMTEPHDITHLPDALRYFVTFFTYPSNPVRQEKTDVEKYRDKMLSGRYGKRRSYF
nr:MAG TPA: Large subunit terminase [Caudoviricetes sp.]